MRSKAECSCMGSSWCFLGFMWLLKVNLPLSFWRFLPCSPSFLGVRLLIIEYNKYEVSSLVFSLASSRGAPMELYYSNPSKFVKVLVLVLKALYFILDWPFCWEAQSLVMNVCAIWMFILMLSSMKMPLHYNFFTTERNLLLNLFGSYSIKYAKLTWIPM